MALRPTIIINVHGGLVQDVFCSDPDTHVVLVDWDQEDEHVGCPGVIEIESDGRQLPVAVNEYDPETIDALRGTDVFKAIEAAHLKD